MSQQTGPWGQPQGQQNYQQGPPQGWAPQDPSQGYPPQQTPAYGTPPNGAPAQGQFHGQPEAFKSAAPSTAGGENPRIGQMNGRLILFRPTGYNPMAKGFGTNPPGPEITTEAIVLDGPPIEGVLDGKTNQMTPFATGPRPTPFYVSTFYLRQQGLIQQLESAVPGREFCLNRVEIRNIGQGKTFYRLLDMTAEDEAMARSIIGNGTIQAGWDRIKSESLARFTAQEPPAGQQSQPPAWGAPAAQQGPPTGWGQPNQQQQGPPQGWGQPTGQPQGPPAGYGQH